jgi:hypothetical protein
MSNRKTTFFYALLIAIASLAVGMVLASASRSLAGIVGAERQHAARQQRADHGRRERDGPFATSRSRSRPPS